MGFWVWKWVLKCLVKCIREAHESPLNLLATITRVIFGAKSIDGDAKVSKSNRSHVERAYGFPS
jgi:hypothetical protein